MTRTDITQSVAIVSQVLRDVVLPLVWLAIGLAALMMPLYLTGLAIVSTGG